MSYWNNPRFSKMYPWKRNPGGVSGGINRGIFRRVPARSYVCVSAGIPNELTAPLISTMLH